MRFATAADRHSLAAAMALSESLLSHHEQEIEIFISCADQLSFDAISSLRIPQIRPRRGEALPRGVKWLPARSFAFGPIAADTRVTPLSRVRRVMPRCVSFESLRMVTHALVVVDEHVDGRFSSDALVRCALPYVNALTRAAAWVRGATKDPSLGTSPHALKAEHTFLAAELLRPALEQRDFPHRVVRLDDVWTCYVSDQLVSRADKIPEPPAPPPPVPHAIFEGDEHPLPAPRVSALVSTYASEDFIEGCLDDLVRQTLFRRGELEVVVVDSASPEREGDIVRRFMRQHPGRVRYLRTREREGVYMAWNRAARAARGHYLTNANTDDRHRPDAYETLARALDSSPHVGLVYGRSFVTSDAGARFDVARLDGRFAWPEYSRDRLLHGCFIGPHPMWRKSVHNEVGWFDQRYRVAGDFEMWMRIAEHYEAMLVPVELGLYLYREESVENANRNICAHESIAARDLYAGRANVALGAGRYPSTYLESFAQPVLAAG